MSLKTATKHHGWHAANVAHHAEPFLHCVYFAVAAYEVGGIYGLVAGALLASHVCGIIVASVEGR